MLRIIFPCAFLLFGLPGFLSAAETSGPRFRIDNELRVEKTGTASKTTTIFSDGLVYDWIAENGEITVFDKKNDSFTLLNPELLLQTKIAASKMKEAVEMTRKEMEKHENPFLAFAVAPKFEAVYEEDTGIVRFQSKWIEYLIETKPLDEADLKAAYFDFCDWYCYFNARFNPGSATLFARMQVNRFLQEKSRFPERIRVHVFSKGNAALTGMVGKPDTFESTHVLGKRLLPGDEAKIAQIREQMKTFRSVSLNDYLKETRKKPEH